MGSDEVLAAVQPTMSPKMNTGLLKPFIAEEVDVALKQMHPTKAPGPDGFSACFYQKFWSIVGESVKGTALEFLNSGIFDPSLNSTYIVLIPKTSPACSVTDYRPISLCNVLYKLVAKVLANRLKKILPWIISQHQSAFVPGRLITDNVLSAYEALHTINSRMQGKKGFMALKLDISKAYYQVEWDFLESMMAKMGFDALDWTHNVLCQIGLLHHRD